jgi:hypothetical protein
MYNYIYTYTYINIHTNMNIGYNFDVAYSDDNEPCAIEFIDSLCDQKSLVGRVSRV